MSREEVAAHLRNLQLSLDTLQRDLEKQIAALPSTKRDELPAALAGVRARLQRFAAEQTRELDDFAAEAGLQLEEDGGAAEAAAASPAAAAAGSPASSGAGTPLGAQLRSLEQRVARMGGTPALGACVLPRMTPGLRPQLNTTASPAAVEIMRGRLGGTDADAAPLRRTASGENSAAPAPLVQLRHTPAPSKGGAAASPLGAAPVNSELAAAIQRRMQRLASASPEKEPGGAAAAAAAAAAAEAAAS